MELERRDTSPDSPARALLQRQALLIEADLRHRGWQIARERAATWLTGLTVLAGLAVAVALAVMMWTASRADGVVVRAFTTPAELAQTGLGGEALAQRFLDRINAHQYATRSTSLQRASGFSGAGDESLRVEIPNTGISLGDLQTFLRGWLGHEKSITGSLSRGASDLVLVVRLSGYPPVQVTGPEPDLPVLLQKAADEVYALADPMRAVAIQPDTPEGRAKRQALLAQLRTVGTGIERADGFAFSASQARDSQLALRYAATAVEMAPDYPMGHAELARTLRGLGRSEAELAATRAARRAVDRPQPLIWNARGKAELIEGLDANLAEFAGDHAEAARLRLQSRDSAARQGFSLADDAPQALAGAHDLAGAERDLEALALAAAPDFFWRLARAQVLAAAGRPAEAATVYAAIEGEMVEADAAARDRGSSQSRLRKFFAMSVLPPHAIALAEAGDLARAQALIAPTAADCYPCLQARGRIAWLAGDFTAAHRWYAAAIKAGPSLPFAYEARGRLALARGDAAGAIADARQAIERGPRWADPLKLWGDALMRQGDRRAAAGKYKAALKLAPRWAELKAAAKAAEG
jgi:tetratricopeptide (TPR) repeat protein